MAKTLFVTGIGTDVGKSYATGWLARKFLDKGLKVATMKFIQTGCDRHSIDIDVHRRLMQTGLLPEDIDLTTAPVIFSYPASPHLAARLDGKEIDFDAIERSRALLESRYDVVLIEGAGGLLVPLTQTMLTVEYPQQHNLPLVLVTNGQLGAISNTLLTLEAIRSRGMALDSVVYNPHFDSDPVIAPDNLAFYKSYLNRYHPDTPLLVMDQV